MKTAVPGGPARRRPDIFVAVLLSASLLAACDCFFGVHGHVTDCTRASPLVGVAVDVHVDRGFEDRMESFPDEATTDKIGAYGFFLNDPCETWATLTFRRAGYATATPPQIRGCPVQGATLDLCLTQGGADSGAPPDGGGAD